MNEIDKLLLDGWNRVAAAVREDRWEALRRWRRRDGMLARPMRAWCLRIRASDTRINDISALVDPPGAVAARLAHRVTIDGRLIRRLTEPVRIPRPGVTYREAARMLGREYSTVVDWARRGVLNVDYYTALRRPHGREPMVWSPTVIDPNARGGRPPHAVWGTLWQTLGEQLPEEYTLTAYRVPRYRRDRRNDARNVFCGWSFICPGRLARSPSLIMTQPQAREACERHSADECDHVRDDEDDELMLPTPGGNMMRMECGRVCRGLYGPQSIWTLAQALGEEFAFDMPERDDGEDGERGDLSLAGQWYPGSAESDPTRTVGTGVRSFACAKCWNLAGETWRNPSGWNQFISHISGGLLYGHEVRCPPELASLARRQSKAETAAGRVTQPFRRRDLEAAFGVFRAEAG